MPNIKPVSELRKKMLAWRKLKTELDEGRRSGEEGRRVPADEARMHFKERYRG